MKKIFIGVGLLMGVSFASNAAVMSSQEALNANKKEAVEVTTSCGSVYDVTCPTCTTQDLVDIALYLDDQDCG